MQWELTLICGLMTSLSLIVAAIALASSRLLRSALRLCSAEIVQLSGRLSDLERSERLTPSKLAELADVRDAIDKGNALLKRVNSREVMRARRDDALAAVDTGNTKDDLRRRAGLVAGKPAPHQ